MLAYRSLLELFKRIDENLLKDVFLCIIGSSAAILMGQQERRTEYVDVWRQASAFDLDVFVKAVEGAGLLWEPKDEFPKGEFLQLVNPGVVQVPGWDPLTRMWFGKKQDPLWKGKLLTVTSPPPESIMASKLLKFNERDLQDCIWMLENLNVSDDDVATALRWLPPDRMSHAEENWLYLKSLLSFRSAP
jgi:hypothetical protein